MRINLQYISFLNGTGYGASARDYIISLLRSRDFDVNIRPIAGSPPRPATSDKQFSELSLHIGKNRSENDISILHCTPLIASNFQKASKKIGFAIYETYEPPSEWITYLNKNDAIIVPSQFNYEIFAHAGIKKPIFKIPHCFDKNLYNRDTTPINKYDKFTFMFAGSWRQRKGYESLLEAWINTFDNGSGVQLVIKTDKGSQAEKYIENTCKTMGKKRGKIASIIVDDKIVNEVEFAGLLKSAHCLVAPSLGEGFLLPGLQCMAMGVPIITTKFSGVLEYANEGNSFLIEPDGFVLKSCLDNITQFKNRKWAFISASKISKSLKYAFENYDELKNKAKIGYNEVHEKYVYEKTAGLFKQMIGEVYGM